MIDEYVIELIGEWIQDYPYLRGSIGAVFIVIAFIFLNNMMYRLGQLLSGDR